VKTKQPTREKILDAAFALVYVHGYNGTSMDMILKERISPRMNDFYELK